MSSAASDPFHFVKDDIVRRIAQAKIKFDNWTYALSNTNTAKNSSFKSDTSQLRELIDGLMEDVRLLGGTLQAVESQRGKYAHISESELSSRKSFIRNTEEQLRGWKRDMGSARTRGKLTNDAREMLTGSRKTEEDSNRYTASNDDFLRDQQQRQATMKRETNQHLDMIGQSVSHLGVMAKTINVELDEQDRMIRDLDKNVDEASASMNAAMKQMSKLLKTKDTCQIWTIVILIIVAVVLFVLVLS